MSLLRAAITRNDPGLHRTLKKKPDKTKPIRAGSPKRPTATPNIPGTDPAPVAEPWLLFIAKCPFCDPRGRMGSKVPGAARGSLAAPRKVPEGPGEALFSCPMGTGQAEGCLGAREDTAGLVVAPAKTRLPSAAPRRHFSEGDL